MSTSDSAIWATLGVAALAALLVLAGLLLALRWRRRTVRRLDDLALVAGQTAALVEELVGGKGGPEPGAGWGPESTLDLDEALAHALRSSTELLGADGALVVMRELEDEPIVASHGLAVQEASPELLRVLPEAESARAVRLDYLYGDEADDEESRLTSGFAVPLLGSEGERAGTLALFWRRGREPAQDTLERFDELARALGPALATALRFTEARRLADRDFVTGLANERYFHDRLAREVARAHRYDRRLTLMLFDLRATATPHTLAEAGGRIRSVVRASDVACHLGEGAFAVLLPESAAFEAERLLRRLQWAVGAPVDSPSDRLRVQAAFAELESSDHAQSLYERVHGTLEERLAAVLPA